MAKRQSRWADSSPSKYPRTARVNQVLREVVASALERLSEDDERLELVTVTGVECEPDLRHATIYFSALGTHASPDEVATALDDGRIEMQSAIAKQVRMKRTPQLRFVPDSGVAEGQKVERLLSGLQVSSSQTSQTSIASDGSATSSSSPTSYDER
jgi:ribosome-binding factor A